MRFREIIEGNQTGLEKALKDQQAAARQNEKIQSSRAAITTAFQKCQQQQKTATKQDDPQKAAQAQSSYQNAVRKAHSSEQKAKAKLTSLKRT